MFKNALYYQENALMQKAVATALTNFAKEDIKSAKKILDVCCGTGFVAEEVLKIHPKAQIFGLERSQHMAAVAVNKYSKIFIEDARNFNAKGYNLTLCCMGLQWFEDIDAIIQKFSQNCTFYFALPLKESLVEINEAFGKHALKSPVMQFKNPAQSPNFVIEYRQHYSNLINALRHFNKIDAKIPGAPKLNHKNIKLASAEFKGEVSWKIGFYQCGAVSGMRPL